MPIVRPRISVDEEFWKAFVAMCRALHVDPSSYIERSLKASLLPFSRLEALTAEVERASHVVTEIHDSINVIGDFIVDRVTTQAEAYQNVEEVYPDI